MGPSAKKRLAKQKSAAPNKKPRLSWDVSAAEFKSLGAELMRRHTAGDANAFDTRWISFFGVEPEVCEDVWRRLSADEPDDKYAEPVHLLWALLLAKTYETEAVLAGICGGCHEDTFSKWAWHFLSKISYLEHEVIVFENRLVNDVGNDCTIQIDGTDCKTTNQGNSLPAFFSFKFKNSGLRYELGTCIRTGELVWINGPFPAGDWPDVEIFRLSLKLQLGENERVEADDGYIGEDPQAAKCPGGVRYMEDKHWNAKRSNVRSRGETANHRLKMFGAIGGTFRHDILKHSMCFRACAVLAQLSFKVGSKSLYPIQNYDQTWMDPSRVPLPADDDDDDCI